MYNYVTNIFFMFQFCVTFVYNYSLTFDENQKANCHIFFFHKSKDMFN